ncbi:hypothetical protein HMPREF1531_01433 [Propionibacterium sp. oral taxon 192 str. F0372]|uniref:hypothetical protein n=1 Tax=Propionibacterium sp. oral taxon 192 TaxID=671222 RepID=UPI000353EE25|nr:hypothetical protein [Propionibacterium sp. oral taxon 192]EPH03374.1 hypothetical protein HMPREF1531_01433 [Propionibacterium sp. oral taxon 192 str. F0372]
MTEFVDDEELVYVGVEDARVVSVVVRPNWKKHYDPIELARVLNALLAKATPPSPRYEPVSVLPDGERVPMTHERSIRFWEEFRTCQELMAKRRERLLAGDTQLGAVAEVEETDPQHHVGAAWVNGRFESMGFDPDWVARATARSISETTAHVLSRHPLVAELVDDPEWDQLQAHRAAMKALRAGK